MTTVPSTPLTVKQAAQALGVSDGRVMQLLRSGVLTLVAPTPVQGRPKHHLDPVRVEALRAQRATDQRQRDPVEVESRRLERRAKRERRKAWGEARAQGLLTFADVSRELGTTRQAVQQRVNRGTLSAVQVAGHRLVQRLDVEALKEKAASGPAATRVLP